MELAIRLNSASSELETENLYAYESSEMLRPNSGGTKCFEELNVGLSWRLTQKCQNLH